MHKEGQEWMVQITGYKALKLTGPGQDIGRLASSKCKMETKDARGFQTFGI